ncbi:MAG: YebC/PmpR family DNA-binding transcriptional regulator, partial [Candidatus Colwellbacteria bacterium]|nr:YebC/PmpR family DNA-binding transcriptional regulator [Candidatus Colwellbacteria bacterium]
MAGHSKWHQIKHKKETTDEKRSVRFTKTLTAIRAAARDDPNPHFNPRLRSLLE